MTRIKIAFFLLSVAACACIFEQIYITEFCREIESLTTSAIISLNSGDKKEFKIKTKKIKEIWERKNDVLFAISGHVILDELAFKINALDEWTEPIYEINAINEAYYENSRIKFSNIL